MIVTMDIQGNPMIQDLLEAGAIVTEKVEALSLLKSLSEMHGANPDAGIYEIDIPTIVGSEKLLIPGGSAMLNLMEDLLSAVSGDRGEGAVCFDFTALDHSGAPETYMFSVAVS